MPTAKIESTPRSSVGASARRRSRCQIASMMRAVPCPPRTPRRQRTVTTAMTTPAAVRDEHAAQRARRVDGGDEARRVRPGEPLHGPEHPEERAGAEPREGARRDDEDPEALRGAGEDAEEVAERAEEERRRAARGRLPFPLVDMRSKSARPAPGHPRQPTGAPARARAAATASFTRRRRARPPRARAPPATSTTARSTPTPRNVKTASVTSAPRAEASPRRSCSTALPSRRGGS